MSEIFWMSTVTMLVASLGVWRTFKNGQIAVATHVLVNNNMAVQLRLHAATARRLAKLTNDIVDMEAADLAENLAREHDGKSV